MKQDKLADALEQISEKHIEEALRPRKSYRLPVLGGIAAVLALALGLTLLRPAAPGAEPGVTHTPTVAGKKLLLAAPEYPNVPDYPTDLSDGAGYSVWWETQRELHNQPFGYADTLECYFREFVPRVLAQGEVCSPVNVYMALAMLAETTGGSTREELLTLLGADSIEALRIQAKHVWTAHYNDDGLATSILGSSLWLKEGQTYNQQTVDALAEHYYASVFQAELGTAEANQALRDWINEHTGELLREQAGNVELSEISDLALATTVYYRVQWVNRFAEQLNTQGIFHGKTGDTEQTFMNQELTYGPYYWSEHFGAVNLSLEDGGRMWLILPDEGIDPASIAGEVMAFLQSDPTSYTDPYENQKEIRVNLSVPKFDVSAQMDLVKVLKEMGITEVFTPGEADFSPIIPVKNSGYVGQVNHAARVAIDEEGVTAAAFTVVDRCGAAAPPVDEIDFILDRPFLFVIESRDGLPLFTGTVYN